MKFERMMMRYLPFFAALLLFAAGCTLHETAQAGETGIEYTVLHVLTESSTVDGMKSQIQEMISAFESTHENVNLILDVLPADGLERQEAISQVYVDISKGQGPDVYLLPNGAYTAVSKGGYQSFNTDPLFEDVTAHIYRGTFADISTYYNADTSLDKENLMTGVMDAGVVDGKRYAIPLRYSIPVLFADADALEASPLSEETLRTSVLAIADAIYKLKDPYLAANADLAALHSRYLFNYFPEVYDYATGKGLLDEDDAAEYMGKSSVIHKWINPEYQISAPHIGSYIATGECFTQKGLFMQASRLESVLDAVAIAKAQNIDLTLIPLRAVDGSLIADVTYFGAVGADCKKPELAYDFLRLFLMEDAQWEVNRPRSTKGFQSGLITAGWPVRAEGAVEHLWRNYQFQLSFYVGQDDTWETRAEALKQINLTEEDLSGLFEQVDIARFNNPVESEWDSHVFFDRDPAYWKSDLFYLNQEIEKKLQRSS